MTLDCTTCIMASGRVSHSRCLHLGPLCQPLTSRRPVLRGHSIRCGVLEIIRQNIGGLDGSRKIQKESRLLRAIQGTRQGLDTSAEQKAEILAAVEDLVEAGAGSATASSSNINATWKLLWTTEKVLLLPQFQPKYRMDLIRGFMPRGVSRRRPYSSSSKQGGLVSTEATSIR